MGTASFGDRVVRGGALVLLLTLTACKADVHLVAQMGRPMDRSVASSRGYEPEFLDEQGSEPRPGSRGTSFVTARDLKVKIHGVNVFRTSTPADVTVDTTNGVVDSVTVLPSQRVPIEEATELVGRVRAELRGQGWREFPACASGLNDPGVWTRCMEDPLEVTTDARRVTMAFEHPLHAYLNAEVRCVQDRGATDWYATTRLRFSTEPTCINSGPSE